MKDQDVKDKFIFLRAEGKSYATISEALGVSKTTLVNWSVDMADQLAAAKIMRQDSLLEEYEMTRTAMMRRLTKFLRRVEDELDTRDLKEVKTEKLVDMDLQLRNELVSEVSRDVQVFQLGGDPFFANPLAAFEPKIIRRTALD